MILQLWLGILVFDVVRAVVVHAIEVIATLDECNLLWRPFRQPVSELFTHGVWVLAKVDWVAKPADGELDLTVTCLTILGIFWIPRFGPVTYTTLAIDPASISDVAISPPGRLRRC